MNTIEIKTNLSGEELQVLMWELEAFCEGKQLSKPVLRQTDFTGSVCDGCGSKFDAMDISVGVCYCCQKEIKQNENLN